MHGLYNEHLVHIGDGRLAEQIAPIQPGGNHSRARAVLRVAVLDLVEIHDIASKDGHAFLLEPGTYRAHETGIELICVYQIAASVSSKYRCCNQLQPQARKI